MLGTLSIFLRPPIQVFFFFLHSLFLQLSNSSYCKLVFVIISIDIILFYLPSVLGSCSACVFMFYLGLKRVRQRGMLICLWGRILRRCFPVTCCKRISWLGGDMLSVCLHFFLHDTSCQPPAVHCVWVATCLFISIHVLQLSVWYLWVFWATRLPFRLNKSCAYIYVYIYMSKGV